MASVQEDIIVAGKYIQLKDSAKSRGIDFELSLKRVRQLMTQKVCYYTRIRFVKDDQNSPYYPTVDRIDASKGYTNDNVVMCVKYINNAKTNLTVTDMRKIFRKLQSVGKL
jgi:spore cortex formation protein SpoVR/YcgB (stage V sporulation)